MADSIGQSFKASEFGAKRGKKKDKQEGLDTPEKREARIQLYMSRVWTKPEDKDDKNTVKGENGRPLNIFTGTEYTEAEMKGEDDCEDETEE
jgi:hypothetical protein